MPQAHTDPSGSNIKAMQKQNIVGSIDRIFTLTAAIWNAVRYKSKKLSSAAELLIASPYSL